MIVPLWPSLINSCFKLPPLFSSPMYKKGHWNVATTFIYNVTMAGFTHNITQPLRCCTSSSHNFRNFQRTLSCLCWTTLIIWIGLHMNIVHFTWANLLLGSLSKHTMYIVWSNFKPASHNQQTSLCHMIYVVGSPGLLRFTCNIYIVLAYNFAAGLVAPPYSKGSCQTNITNFMLC